MQHDAADELHAEGLHAQHAPGGLPHGGEGLGQDIVQLLAVGQTVLEDGGLLLQLAVGHGLVAAFQPFDFIDNRIDPFQLPVGITAEEFVKQSHACVILSVYIEIQSAL